MEPKWTACHECNRGGRGNDKDKCACGWKIVKPSRLGCYMGTAIVGEPVKPPKLTRSQERYRHYLDVSDCFESFGGFLRAERRTA
jgi:hypothetical protein